MRRGRRFSIGARVAVGVAAAVLAGAGALYTTASGAYHAAARAGKAVSHPPAVDDAEAVKAAQGGQVEYRAQKEGIVHAGVGKASFTEKALIENVKAIVDAINKAKPSGAKGTYLRRVSLSSTMGPGLKLDLTTVTGGNASCWSRRTVSS